MAGFLYFAEGWATPISRDNLAEIGVAYALDETPTSGVIRGRTPSGGDGTILADQRALSQGRLEFHPDPSVQTWRKNPTVPRLWVGYWNAAPPTPEDLSRPTKMPGERIELGDGRRWTVPRLLAFETGETPGFVPDLPCYADLDETGRWINGATARGYEDVAALAARLYEGMIQAELGQAARLSTDEVLDMSVKLLARNYRIGAVEAAILRLFVLESCLRDLVKGAADWGTFLEWCEKKTAESAPAATAG